MRRERERSSDRQPHPLLLRDDVGTWRALPGDWSAGYRWEDGCGRRVSDVGGNLLRQLELTGTPWAEVLRSNRATSTRSSSRSTATRSTTTAPASARATSAAFTSTPAPEPLPLSDVTLLRAPMRRLNWERQRRWERDLRARQLADAQRIVEQIERGDRSWVSELR